MMNIVINTCTGGLLSIDLPFIEDEDIFKEKEDSLFGFLSRLHIHVSGPNPLGKNLARELKDYFYGENPRFSDYPVIWDKTSNFRKRVLYALKDIPYGKTISYSELAKSIGCPDAARAVGQALNRNPWPVLFPCHRVIGKNGHLKGFSSGIAWKRILLKIEKSAKEIDK
ncbi:MAG: methylated-DNA--[protein]-cysteine S-methyltransferase [bacterium]